MGALTNLDKSQSVAAKYERQVVEKIMLSITTNQSLYHTTMTRKTK